MYTMEEVVGLMEDLLDSAVRDQTNHLKNSLRHPDANIAEAKYHMGWLDGLAAAYVGLTSELKAREEK